MSKLHVVIVTGLSGGGRSATLNVLEDLGFFCVDNLPPVLVPTLVETIAGGGEVERIGLGVDVRGGPFLSGAGRAVDDLSSVGHDVDVLFLDCADDVLVRRFSETRRPHALAPGGDVLAGITKERERLRSLRARATQVIDTTQLSVHDLRRVVVDHVARGGRGMVIRVVSFGFKYGSPNDADLMFDVRYLPNPYFDPELKPMSGLDKPVSEYVLGSNVTQELIARLTPLLDHSVPEYLREGKAYLTIAIGCTGGRHRSVALSEYLGDYLRKNNAPAVHVVHRDVHRKKPT